MSEDGEEGRRERFGMIASLRGAHRLDSPSSLRSDARDRPMPKVEDMSVDPHVDYHSHDPKDEEPLSENPAIREAQLHERRMRRALASKEDPMHDDESTVERMRRQAAEDEEAERTREETERDAGPGYDI